ncbi:DUF2190 family protein [Neorhizobium sp. NCHU2750]|uniref:DUF2190 family protein n=1 Tax=Neorhizobium sp. NCHU2750 TaxID=1825976 RepID=UPI000E76BF33|nr:virion protein [Neorhizobium sp. NCHU2750]
MAYEERLSTITLIAAADYSDASAQYRFVISSGEGGFLRSTAGADAIGVCQDDPNLNQASCIAIGGISKLIAGDVITAGDPISSDDEGRAVTAASGDFILGTAINPAAAAGIVIPVLFEKAGKA